MPAIWNKMQCNFYDRVRFVTAVLVFQAASKKKFDKIPLADILVIPSHSITPSTTMLITRQIHFRRKETFLKFEEGIWAENLWDKVEIAMRLRVPRGTFARRRSIRRRGRRIP